MRRRVVVTGMGGICPLGRDWKTVYTALHSGRSAISNIPELATYEGMDTQLAAVVDGFEVPEHYPRKRIRTMGRVSLLATVATEVALEDAGLMMNPVVSDGSTGISYGSTSGSPPAMEVYASTLYTKRTLKGIRAIDYIQFMSHTVPANIAQFFGVRGRIVTTCSACTSGSQGIGYGFEAIQSGKQQVMITGGAEEFHPVDAAVFDVLINKVMLALERTGYRTVVLGGGVACSRTLAARMAAAVEGHARLAVAEPRLNADNAAMIARAGWFHLDNGRDSNSYLDADPRMPWPGLERDREPFPTTTEP